MERDDHLREVSVLAVPDADLTPALREEVAANIPDFGALALLAARPTPKPTHRHSVRAARFEAVKTAVAQNLGRPDLSAQTVARGLGISASYVQKLFHDEQTTFSTYVLEARLAWAFDALERRSDRAGTISALAYETGFGDLSYFNRAFRHRYGVTPSNVRAAARRKPSVASRNQSALRPPLG